MAVKAERGNDHQGHHGAAGDAHLIRLFSMGGFNRVVMKKEVDDNPWHSLAKDDSASKFKVLEVMSSVRSFPSTLASQTRRRGAGLCPAGKFHFTCIIITIMLLIITMSDKTFEAKRFIAGL